jgi:hypothetical protein
MIFQEGVAVPSEILTQTVVPDRQKEWHRRGRNCRDWLDAFAHGTDDVLVDREGSHIHH